MTPLVPSLQIKVTLAIKGSCIHAQDLFFFLVPTEICRRDTVSQGPHTTTPTSSSALPGAASGTGAEIPGLAEGDMLQPHPCKLHLWEDRGIPGFRVFWIHDSWSLSQELIRNKARNRQNCALLEQAYAVVSALPQRAENKLHVSLMENYPGTLEALGEPIRQVGRLGTGGEVVCVCVSLHEAFGGGAMRVTA